MTLTLVHSRADLPPLWDGAPVTWGPWKDAPVTTWRFHASVAERACTSCGLIDGREKVNLGVVDGLWRLLAYRCECGHDVVFNHETGEAWDLDPSDYGPEGSVDPNLEGKLF